MAVRRGAIELRLTVCDNGKGFTPGVAGGNPASGGFGLIGILERAQLLGGDPVVHSAPGQGTTISIGFRSPNTAMENEIRVVIADDHPIVRRGLRQTIEGDPILKVLAEAGDGQAALAQIRELKPAIAVLDVDMPRLDGLGVAREIGRRGYPSRLSF